MVYALFTSGGENEATNKDDPVTANIQASTLVDKPEAVDVSKSIPVKAIEPDLGPLADLMPQMPPNQPAVILSMPYSTNQVYISSFVS